ncbi:hypothetical protein OIU78_024049 [Salix suchowensis]|nr:hypothetical protein OIU78_024049 [Salix suchowensis]
MPVSFSVKNRPRDIKIRFLNLLQILQPRSRINNIPTRQSWHTQTNPNTRDSNTLHKPTPAPLQTFSKISAQGAPNWACISQLHPPPNLHLEGQEFK